MHAIMPAQRPAPGAIDREWRMRAVIDAPRAFRAVIRTAIEGAEGAAGSPGNRVAATIFGLLTQGDLRRLTPILAELMAAARRDGFPAAPGPSGQRGSMGPYGTAFVEFFLEASDRFSGFTGTIGDYLAAGARDDERIWRTALEAIAPRTIETVSRNLMGGTGVTDTVHAAGA